MNFSSESVHIPEGGYPFEDARNLRAIHRAHGSISLQTFPIIGSLEYLWLARIRRQIQILKPLNYLPYDKEVAKRELVETYGFVDYGSKHQESRFTKFYQEIYLPARYGFDKRRLHCSALIVSGQMTRKEALQELSVPLTTEEQAARDKRFVAKKLGITVIELERLIALPAVRTNGLPTVRRFTRLTREFENSSGVADDCLCELCYCRFDDQWCRSLSYLPVEPLRDSIADVARVSSDRLWTRLSWLHGIS